MGVIQRIGLDQQGGAFSINFASPTGVGNSIVVCAWTNGNNNINSVSDAGTSSYTKPVSIWNNCAAAIFFATGITGGFTQVNINAGGGARAGAMIYEVTPLQLVSGSYVDQTATGNPTSTTNPSTSSATTTQAGDIVFASLGIQGTGTGTTAGAGFTCDPFVGGASEFQIQSSAGSIAGAFTNPNSTNYSCAMAAFFFSSGPPPPSSGSGNQIIFLGW